jgi:hypothetical protein
MNRRKTVFNYLHTGVPQSRRLEEGAGWLKVTELEKG